LMSQIPARADQRRPKSGFNANENVIQRALGADYSDFKKAKSKENTLSDARSALKLLEKSKAKLKNMRKGSVYDEDAVDAYIIAWRLCLQVMTATKDPEAKSMLLTEWNQGLRDDNEEIALQFVAIDN